MKKYVYMKCFYCNRYFFFKFNDNYFFGQEDLAGTLSIRGWLRVNLLLFLFLAFRNLDGLEFPRCSFLPLLSWILFCSCLRNIRSWQNQFVKESRYLQKVTSAIFN